MSNKDFDSNKIKKIMSEVFKIDESLLSLNPKQSDIENWDSLSHLMLIMEIEKEFKVKFKTEIIPTLTSLEKIYSEINVNR